MKTTTFRLQLKSKKKKKCPYYFFSSCKSAATLLASRARSHTAPWFVCPFDSFTSTPLIYMWFFFFASISFHYVGSSLLFFHLTGYYHSQAYACRCSRVLFSLCDYQLLTMSVWIWTFVRFVVHKMSWSFDSWIFFSALICILINIHLLLNHLHFDSRYSIKMEWFFFFRWTNERRRLAHIWTIPAKWFRSPFTINTCHRLWTDKWCASLTTHVNYNQLAHQ